MFFFSDGSVVPIQSKGFKCTGGYMADEAVSLLRSFYEQGNPNGKICFPMIFWNSPVPYLFCER
jgi:hypothetical protein